jgi:transposase
MRKSINGLSILVQDDMHRNPTEPGIFVFWNRKLNKLKFLYWHINGFCLCYKILERQKFKIPMPLPKQLVVTTKELQWLLDGLDFSKLIGHKELKYEIFS